ncbi:MAG: T9SS type A sorting domain-containing protein [Haliscomenobacter sp.]|nr:T9SS type A sorting domain-containing protein [Haliscomenobacter sp.]
MNDLQADVKADFIAVKVGDVNGNALANSLVRTAGSFSLNADDVQMKAGNEYRIAFTGDLSQIEGYQFTMGFDRNLVELADIEYSVAKAENFGVFAKEGMITASWNEAQGAGHRAQGETLFTLVVKAKADVSSLSEVLNINSRITRAEAYRTGGDYLSVALALTPQRLNASMPFALLQNVPNPFQGETVIGFTLPAAGEATLTIQDVTGRTLRVIRGPYAQGYNQVILKSNELNNKGILTYTLRSGEHTASKRMIILE